MIFHIIIMMILHPNSCAWIKYDDDDHHHLVCFDAQKQEQKFQVNEAGECGQAVVGATMATRT